VRKNQKRREEKINPQKKKPNVLNRECFGGKKIIESSSVYLSSSRFGNIIAKGTWKRCDGKKSIEKSISRTNPLRSARYGLPNFQNTNRRPRERKKAGKIPCVCARSPK
jgi:hypothetical protein